MAVILNYIDRHTSIHTVVVAFQCIENIVLPNRFDLKFDSNCIYLNVKNICFTCFLGIFASISNATTLSNTIQRKKK